MPVKPVKEIGAGCSLYSVRLDVGIRGNEHQMSRNEGGNGAEWGL